MRMWPTILVPACLNSKKALILQEHSIKDTCTEDEAKMHVAVNRVGSKCKHNLKIGSLHSTATASNINAYKSLTKSMSIYMKQLLLLLSFLICSNVVEAYLTVKPECESETNRNICGSQRSNGYECVYRDVRVCSCNIEYFTSDMVIIFPLNGDMIDSWEVIRLFICYQLIEFSLNDNIDHNIALIIYNSKSHILFHFDNMNEFKNSSDFNSTAFCDAYVPSDPSSINNYNTSETGETAANNLYSAVDTAISMLTTNNNDNFKVIISFSWYYWNETYQVCTQNITDLLTQYNISLIGVSSHDTTVSSDYSCLMNPDNVTTNNGIAGSTSNRYVATVSFNEYDFEFLHAEIFDTLCWFNSLSPTSTPTMTPTGIPSPPPTTATSTPTRLPTNFPSNAPSGMPSTTPSRLPTKLPTELPTKLPSLAPSNLPTTNPTRNPSLKPSLKPSIIPSLEPTKIPSSNPTSVISTSDFNSNTNMHTTSKNNNVNTNDDSIDNNNESYKLKINIGLYLSYPVNLTKDEIEDRYDIFIDCLQVVLVESNNEIVNCTKNFIIDYNTSILIVNSTHFHEKVFFFFYIIATDTYYPNTTLEAIINVCTTFQYIICIYV